MSDQDQRDDEEKLHEAFMVRGNQNPYQPVAGRADRLEANIPGARSIGSTKGTIR